MDKISDFLKELRERVSSPFFFSFLLSWLLINWRIPIALIFYKSEDLTKDGFKSYMDLITKQYGNGNMFWWPLFSALVYTFLYPLFKNAVILVNAWYQRWGTNFSLQISKKGKMPVEKYIKLRQSYVDRTELLEKILREENAFSVQKIELQNDNLLLMADKQKLEADLQTLQATVDNWSRSNQLKYLAGYWQYSEINLIKVEEIKRELVIKPDGAAYLYFSATKETGNIYFSIANINHNLESKHISLEITYRYAAKTFSKVIMFPYASPYDLSADVDGITYRLKRLPD